MTPYAEIRRLTFALEAGRDVRHLERSAAIGLWRARLLATPELRQIPAARARRRSLLLCVRAYESLIRHQRRQTPCTY